MTQDEYIAAQEYLERHAHLSDDPCFKDFVKHGDFEGALRYVMNARLDHSMDFREQMRFAAMRIRLEYVKKSQCSTLKGL